MPLLITTADPHIHTRVHHVMLYKKAQTKGVSPRMCSDELNVLTDNLFKAVRPRESSWLISSVRSLWPKA